jgi:hypothetical protein
LANKIGVAATTAEQVKLDSGDGGRLPATWLEEEAADFTGFVERRCAVRELWGVSVTELWFGDGTDYLGAVIIRHASTPDLEREGGHIGYHVVPGQRRHSHASQMLAQAKPACQRLASPRSWSPAPRATSAPGGDRSRWRYPRPYRRWTSPLPAPNVSNMAPERDADRAAWLRSAPSCPCW